MSKEFDPKAHEAEAKERWGGTEAYKESARRTKSYSPEQVAAIQEELEDIESRMARLLQSGTAPSDEAAMELAEEARLHIDRWYYPCSPGTHAALAELYTTDPRFTAAIDAYGPGLARFLAKAIEASRR